MEATASGLTTGTLGAFTVDPGVAAQVALTRLDGQPDLGRGPAPDGDHAGRGGEHGHERQHDLDLVHAVRAARARVSGTGSRHRLRRRRREGLTGLVAGPVTVQVTATGLTGATLGFTVVHGAATQVALTGCDHGPRVRLQPDS